MQLAQLPFGHHARRFDHQILAALRFRERNHFANRLGAGHQRHQAIKTKGNAAVRRRTIGQRIKQKAELGARFLRRNAQCGEHLRLHFGAVDPY